MEITRNGAQPSSKGPAEYFTGIVRIDPLFQAPEPARGRDIDAYPHANFPDRLVRTTVTVCKRAT